MKVHQNNLVITSWEDYELLDSGDGKKLERFEKVLMIRPEMQALWKPLRPEIWKTAQAEFLWHEGKGVWKKKNMPDAWYITWRGAQCSLRTTSFKHIGIFPEQAGNWEWLEERVKSLSHPSVLNLFGYTGIASIVALHHGAKVMHIDASKQSNVWAKENAEQSKIPPASLKVLLDDALKFAEREVRRESSYEGIILDPPAFGRGPKGEIWKIEESLPKLLTALQKILSSKAGSFFLINGYASGYSPTSFLQMVQSFFPDVSKTEFGELTLQEKNSLRVIPSGIYVRFVR